MKYPIFALGLLLLTSCAPVNEDQCRGGNWHGIGLRDGANGRAENFIASIAEECAKFGVSVNQNEWLQGRVDGLKTYCTVENAENIGRRGGQLNPVCKQNAQLYAANQHGKNYFALTQKLDQLKNERDELEEILSNGFEGELTPAQKRLYYRYVNRLDDTNDDIRSIKRELDFYPRYI